MLASTLKAVDGIEDRELGEGVSEAGELTKANGGSGCVWTLDGCIDVDMDVR